MIDFARIVVRAGDGGSGSGSFHHIKGKRWGKADGGDGGRGGDVYLEATADMGGLEPFRFVREYHARFGQPGLSRRRTGARGADLVVKVPVGTMISLRFGNSLGRDQRSVGGLHGVQFRQNSEIAISRASSSERANQRSPKTLFLDEADILTQNPLTTYDLAEIGQKVLVARGGEGGRGNVHLKDEFGRRPRVAEKGEKGEVLHLTLELKLIADVGLVGLPNAGKSTLLAALTLARPAIAPYPFTTLEPNLGVMNGSWLMVHGSLGGLNKENINYERLTINDSHIVIADIPGLIEGASSGRGLGDLFLRHIERTRILVHLIDGSQVLQGEGKGQEVSEAGLWKAYQTIRGELKSYSRELAKKKEIIAITKVDLVPKSDLLAIGTEFAKHRKKPFFISAQSGEGLEELISEMRKKVN